MAGLPSKFTKKHGKRMPLVDTQKLEQRVLKQIVDQNAEDEEDDGGRA